MDIRMTNIATPMPQIRAKFTNKLGIPLSGCKVYTYEPNSNIPKTTWLNINKTVENTNPILLDAAGEADIFLDGLYRVVVKDRFGFVVYDVEKTGAHTEWDASFIVDSSGLSQQEINNKNNTISHVALMLDAPVVNGKIFNVLSRDSPNFELVKPYSGGGLFKWDASSTATPDGGTVFTHNTVASGRFLRIIDSDVHVSWFAGHGWTNEDKTTRVQQAIDFANRLDRASALHCDGKFTITQLMIDRLTDATVGDFVIYATGNNDGFRIDSPSTMFSSRLPYNPNDAPAYTKAPCSEFTIFRNIDFEASIAHVDNCVFDDKFLRLTFDGCTHRKMRGCKQGEYLQTIKWMVVF